METFVWAATTLFLFLGIIMSSKDRTNIAAKTTMICLSAWGAILLAQAHGIIHLR